MVKRIIAQKSGNYIGKYKNSNTWHRIVAKTKIEAIAKMLKGTRYQYSDVIVKRR